MQFLDMPETGMGFHFVDARTLGEKDDSAFIVLGSTYAFPIEPYAGLTSIKNINRLGALDELGADSVVRGELKLGGGFGPNPIEARAIMGVLLSMITSPDAPAKLDENELAQRLTPPPGTPLTVKSITNGLDAFLRYSFTKHDPRISPTGTVAAGTYTTTFRDGASVNSGLSAVARYALPVPLPAEYVFFLTPPPRTVVHLGAAGPLFGQSGGGVEAFFPNGFANTLRSFAIPPY